MLDFLRREEFASFDFKCDNVTRNVTYTNMECSLFLIFKQSVTHCAETLLCRQGWRKGCETSLKWDAIADCTNIHPCSEWLNGWWHIIVGGEITVKLIDLICFGNILFSWYLYYVPYRAPSRVLRQLFGKTIFRTGEPDFSDYLQCTKRLRPIIFLVPIQSGFILL